MVARRPVRMSLVFAVFKQSNVLLVDAVCMHGATPSTKFVQSFSRRDALEMKTVAAIPDSSICAEIRASSGSQNKRLTAARARFLIFEFNSDTAVMIDPALWAKIAT
jgi:hypothetical protein